MIYFLDLSDTDKINKDKFFVVSTKDDIINNSASSTDNFPFFGYNLLWVCDFRRGFAIVSNFSTRILNKVFHSSFNYFNITSYAAKKRNVY